MKIKFFGHSLFKCRKPNERDHGYDTFPTNLMARYDCRYVDDRVFGVAKCSEERILFFLKKTKDIDIAIIAHGPPDSVFCISTVKDFTQGIIRPNEYEYYRSKKLNVSYHGNKLDIPTVDAPATHMDWESFNQDLLISHRWFYHPDLQMNRYNGALMQIDAYLTAMGIPAIHLIHVGYIPSWFKFSSGIVDTEIVEWQHIDPYRTSYNTSPNALTEEANLLVEEKMVQYIELLKHRLT